MLDEEERGLFGMENSFSGALAEHINACNVDGIHAEFVETGVVRLDSCIHHPRGGVCRSHPFLQYRGTRALHKIQNTIRPYAILGCQIGR